MRDRGCVTSKSSIAYKAKARHKATRATETEEEGGGVDVAKHGMVRLSILPTTYVV